MSGTVRRSRIERGLASVVLASFLLSFAPPPAAAVTGLADCMVHHPAAATVAADNLSHGADCAGGLPRDCRAMPGCATSGAALLVSPVALLVPLVPHAAVLARAPFLTGLPGLGPPTPPPNS